MFTLTLVALLLFNCPYVAPAVIGTRIQDRTGIVQTFLSYMSPMGMTIKSKGEEGLLVLSSPKNSTQHNEYACSPVLPARPRIISGFPWVLLIRQGKCEFATKLLNAQDAGYELVIVYNDQDDHILPMDGIYHFYLKAVFVGLSSGEVLKQYYLFSKNPTARVTLTPYYTISWRMYIIPFLVVIGICCVLMLIFLLIKKVRRYQRRRRARLPASKLKKLKIIVFSDKNIAYDMCAICLDDFEDGDKLRILPCNHGFHSHCIDPWLTKRRRVCPCCKQVVFPEAPPNESQSLPSLSSTYDEERSIGPSVVPDETTPLVP